MLDLQWHDVPGHDFRVTLSMKRYIPRLYLGNYLSPKHVEVELQALEKDDLIGRFEWIRKDLAYIRLAIDPKSDHARLAHFSKSLHIVPSENDLWTYE
jgi:hypothetical protein